MNKTKFKAIKEIIIDEPKASIVMGPVSVHRINGTVMIHSEHDRFKVSYSEFMNMKFKQLEELL